MKQQTGSEISGEREAGSSARRGPWEQLSTPPDGLSVCEGVTNLGAPGNIIAGLPNQEAWPAKWLDSEEPTAREGFVRWAHFDAGTRLRLHKETRAPST